MRARLLPPVVLPAVVLVLAAASTGARAAAVTRSTAATRSTAVTVTVRNATGAALSHWRLRVHLGAGTRLVAATGARPDRRTQTVVLTPKPATLAAGARRVLVLRIHGARRPSAFAIPGRAPRTCVARSATRSGTRAQIVVACTVTSAAAAAGASAPTPSSSTPTPSASTPTPTPSSSTPTPTPAPTHGSPAASRWYPFAPYVDMAAYPAPDLGAMRTQGGATHLSLGFVTARNGTDCVPTWGGYAAYPASGASPYLAGQVAGLKAAGGDGVVSFGGAAGTELAKACPTVAALASAYQSAIDAYGATHVDFDVEGAGVLTDTTANDRRAKAIAQLQGAAAAAGRTLLVAFTLPVEPSGLDGDGQALVRQAAGDGVDIAIVNGMAMDYADDGAEMGDRALGVAGALRQQLVGLIPGVTAATALAHVGITPMIGINDMASEVFTLGDAGRVAAWAAANHPGMLGMWQIGRDHQCATATTTTSETCSGVTQGEYAFSHALGAFTG